MSYEIPQQLEYKEKIIFGLTFRQLAYVLLFAPLILITFFRTNLHLFVKIFVSINLSAFAVGFIFLNLDKNLKIWYIWLKNRKIETADKLVKSFPIKSLQDDFIVRNDGKKVAILKITPMNFSIKPKDSKMAITLAFQKFLNSLDFPIQILMNTENIELNDYFSEVDKKISSTEFKRLFKGYKEHLHSLTSSNNVMNRNFYLIIPEKSDLEIQTQICQSKLANVGIKSYRMKKSEIHKLFDNYLGVEKKKSLFPIENNSSFLKIGNNFVRTIYAHGYPRSVESGFLDKIVSLSGNFDLSLHIEPYDLETMMVNLNKELQKQRADLYSAKIKNILNPSLEIQYKDTKAVLQNLQKGKEKLFNVSLYINCRAKSKEDLQLLTKKIEAELNSLLIIPKHANFRMLQGFKSCSPLAINSLKKNRNITTEALSAFFPFTSSFLQVDKTGVWFGLNKNKIPLIKDIFSLSNPNGICLASSGSGKSYMSKLLISRHLLNGTKVMVIDPQGEYRNLVKKFNGQLIDLSRTSETIINPLDLMGHDYAEKRLALMDLMPIMLGELSEPQKSFIDKALTEAYSECRISHDPKTWKNSPPILEDVLRALVKIERSAVQLEKVTIRSLINRLSMYTEGVFSFLNQQTNINFGNRFVCFDIGNLPKQVKPTMMFLVLDYIYMKMKRDLERKLLVIDEAWSLLGRTRDASYIFEIVKTCRKFNLALFLINQEVEGMLESEAGKSVLANSSYTLLMRQKPAVMRNIEKTFFLSGTEKNTLLTAGVGEGLLLMDDEHSEIKIVASDEEHNLITTKPDELLQLKNVEEKNFKKINKIDLEQRVHSSKNLNNDDKIYLISKGFKEHSQKDIYCKKEIFFIKPTKQESAQHMILVFELEQHLRKIMDNVQTYLTVKPDIVFATRDKKYAIEVETGTALERNRLGEKKDYLNKNYGANWFFVVTNRNMKKSYAKYGKTFDKRNVIDKIEKMVWNVK